MIKQKKSQRLTPEQIRQRIFAAHGDSVKIIGEYTSNTTKTTFEHQEYGLWEATPGNVFRGRSHPSGKVKKTKELFQKKYGTHPMNVPEIQQKFNQTMKDRYGAEWATQSTEILKKIEDNNIEKFGTKCSLQNKEIAKIAKKSMQEKYGVSFPSQNKEIQEKIKKTNLEKYGFENSLQNKEVQNKRKKTNLEKYGFEVSTQKHMLPEWLSLQKIQELTKYSISSFYQKSAEWQATLEETFWLIMTDSSPRENKLEQSFQELTGVSFHNKQHLGYRPDFKISHALYANVDGRYWHSEERKGKNYHFDMRIKYEQNGDKILQFTDHEVEQKGSIVKSMVDARSGATRNKLMARKLELRPLNPLEQRNFFIENHLKGSTQAIAFGLFQNNNCMAAISVKRTKDNIVKIERFCNKIDTIVVGGYSKLLKHVEKTYQPKEIHTWVDLRYGTGNHLESLGFSKLGPVERRWSYASWTGPSHYNLLTGLLPHTSPPNVYASEYYKEDFYNFNKRLGAKDVEFAKMVPGLWLPGFLKDTLGYETHARVSLPVLNPRTGVNRDFDSFQLMDKHNDMRSMLKTLKFPTDRPGFFLMNVGETHYPYAKPDEDSSMWPRISGVNGVFKKLESQIDERGNLIHESEVEPFFDQDKLDQLKERQVETVRYLDGVFAELWDICPKNTYVVVTADHGELFGEGGYFGHGPIMHEKCFEVPFLEGQIR